MRSEKGKLRRGGGIVSIGFAFAGAVLSGTAVGRVWRKKTDQERQTAEKNRVLMLLLNRWLQAKQEGRRLDAYLLNAGYRTVAIYGMSYIGERLYLELKDTGVQVKYGIDQSAAAMSYNLPVYKPEDRLERVDAVIVTAVHFYDSICERMRRRVDCPILSLEEILFDL